MKRGLVLEGGAMRGLFSAGVTDVLMENGILFDGAIGVSAGAAFGCNYKSRQPGRVIRYNRRFARDPRYAGIRSFLRTGDIFGAEFDYRTLPCRLDVMDSETYAANPMEFWFVCTDVRTGRPVYHRSDDLSDEELEWMRASASMPLVSRIVRAGGYELLDGGVADSIPLRRFQLMGYDRNVVILTQPDGFIKQPNRMLPVLKVMYGRKYPAFVAAVGNRHIRYNRQLSYVRAEEEAGRVLVIRPEEALGIHSVEHDPDEMQRVYNLGRAAGESRLQEIRSFLQEEDAEPMDLTGVFKEEHF